MKTVKESDWKVFRKLRQTALERYCKRILAEVRHISRENTGTFHQRYLDITSFLDDCDRHMAHTFNNPRRSSALMQIAKMLALNLITTEEFVRFSEETTERVKALCKIYDA